MTTKQIDWLIKNLLIEKETDKNVDIKINPHNAEL
jgi:hypothetical protein